MTAPPCDNGPTPHLWEQSLEGWEKRGGLSHVGLVGGTTASWSAVVRGWRKLPWTGTDDNKIMAYVLLAQARRQALG